MTLKPTDIEGLPKELIAQLSINDSDIFNFKIHKIIEENGGTATLDFILVKLWDGDGVVYERIDIAQRIYRMARKGLISYVKGLKATYTIESAIMK